MDRKQLVTIAITAVTSVVAKEVISWLVAVAKNTAKTQTARTKARTIFSKNNRRSLGAVAFLALTGSGLWLNLHESTPVTRVAVVWTVASLLNFGVALVYLSFNVTSRIDEWMDKPKTVHPVAPVPAATVSADTADSQQTPDIPDASQRLS